MPECQGKVRVRFPGSPTGAPHIGNMRTALFNWLYARRHGGVFIVRMEDTDQTRSTRESAEQILAGLTWLGLDWDEGPHVGGPEPSYFQSERLDIYAAEAAKLEVTGLLYRCYCTTAELAERKAAMEARHEAPRYDRKCLSLSASEREAFEAAGRPYVLRYKMPVGGAIEFDDLIRGKVAFQATELDDWVVVRTDGFPTYNFVVAIDDHSMGITHVIRGEDHISNTPKQILIYQGLGYQLPQFAHLPMILGKDKTKLSKRHGATSIVEYKDMGFLPDAMANYLALLGWSPGDGREVMSREEIVASFSIECITKHAAVFDTEKLTWLNGQHMRRLPVEQFAAMSLDALQTAGIVSDPPTDAERAVVEEAAPLVQDRVNTLLQIPGMYAYYFTELPEYDPDAVQKRLCKGGAADVLSRIADEYAKADPWTSEELERIARQVAEDGALSTSAVFHPVRVATTGVTMGPGLFDTLRIIGRDRVVARLKHAITLCKP